MLAVIGVAFGFVYWLHNTSSLTERAIYRIRFENTVSGLLTGAAVLFNGIRVGEVTALELDARNPNLVMATVAVAAGTPVRADTKVLARLSGSYWRSLIVLQGGSKPLSMASPGEVSYADCRPACGPEV